MCSLNTRRAHWGRFAVLRARGVPAEESAAPDNAAKGMPGRSLGAAASGAPAEPAEESAAPDGVAQGMSGLSLGAAAASGAPASAVAAASAGQADGQAGGSGEGEAGLVWFAAPLKLVGFATPHASAAAPFVPSAAEDKDGGRDGEGDTGGDLFA